MPMTKTPTGFEEFTLLEQPEAFPKLPELADRLGVEEGIGDSRLWMVMKDGRRYDVFCLVNAFLDRLDEATK